MLKRKTAFDQVVKDILSEMNFGKGGMSNMSGSTTTNPGIPQSTVNSTINRNTKMQFAGNPKHPVINANNNSNDIMQSDPNEEQEFQDFIELKNTNRSEYDRKYNEMINSPDGHDKISRLISYISGDTNNLNNI